MQPAATRIRERLNKIVNGVAELLRGIPVLAFGKRVDDNIIFVMPEQHWGEPSPEQRSRQMKLKKDYDALTELMNLFLRQAPSDFVQQFEVADKEFRQWLDLDSNWALSPDLDENEQSIREAGAGFEPFLSLFDVTGTSEVFVVPDTNALLATADPVRYRGCAEQDSFTFTLLPTVLGDLDRLKIEHRNEDVREKARKIITRISGWRNQGSLIDGVTVDRNN